MKTTPTRSLLLALALAAFALPSFAVEATKISDVAHSVFFRGGKAYKGSAGTNGGHWTNRLFDGDFTNYTYCNNSGDTYLVIDVSYIVTDPEGESFVTDVLVGHQGNAKYSLYYTTEPAPDYSGCETGSDGGGTYYVGVSSDDRTWTAIDGATSVQEAGTKTYGVNQKVTAIKYVFDTFGSWTTSLAEVEVQGYEYVPPKAVKISSLDRSHFIRGNRVYVGNAGLNGGHWTSRLFDGDFTNYSYCNNSGTTELVIPTTGLDDQGNDTGISWYVTEVKVGHQGNAKYSLYYTTEAAPDYSSYETANDSGTYYVGLTSDDRTWIAIDGATGIQEAGTKTYGVNQKVTAIKYVFDTFGSWTTSLAEVEVWAMDPSSITCLHPNMTDESPAWIVCTPATCTENAFEERFCPDCGARFEREVPLSKLGHDFFYTLTEPGTTTSYGSGYVECSRCDEFHIVFDGDIVDLTTLGGPPINGVVQFTDLYASSLGAEDGSIKPIYMMDNIWDNGWGHAYYFAECSSNEYAQYSFGTPIDLTKIEYSVINESQTVYFSKYDPATGVETLLKTIPIVKDTSEGALGYQRRTVTFTREAEGGDEPSPAPTFDPAPTADDSNASGITVDVIRMRIGDYVDPATGEVTRYIGYNYGAHDRHTIICEFHPWGTIPGAGKVDSGAKPAFLFMQ